MKQTLFAALLLAFTLPAPAHAADKPKPKLSADHLICRDQDEIGSRLRTRRVCMTREQWEAARRDAQDSVALGQTRAATTCPPKTICS